MWSRVKSVRRLVVMLASAASLLPIVPAILHPSAALAQSPGPGSEVAEVVEEDRRGEGFMFGIQFPFGFTMSEQTGSVRTLASSPTGAFPPYPFRTVNDRDDFAISPFVGFGVEIWTPALPVIPGGVRVFLNAEILPTFASPRTLGSEGEPGPTTLPPDRSLIQTPELAVGGAGTRLNADVMTTSLSAAIGLAIPTTIRGKRVYFKPWVGWLRQGIIANGVVKNHDKDDVNPFDDALNPFGPNLRTVELQGHEADFYNGVGPGLEIELVTGRFGWVRPSVYISGGAYRLVDNEPLVLRAFERTPALPPILPPPTNPPLWLSSGLPATDYSAEWIVTVDDWTYRAGVGLRIMWLGRR